MFASQFQSRNASFERFPPRVEPYQVLVMVDDQGRMLAVSIGTGIDLRSPGQQSAESARSERAA